MSVTDRQDTARGLSPAAWAGIVAGLIAATAVILLLMGRTPICTCGTVKLWVGEPNGPDNSQHLLDWYSASHLIHGLIFYGLLVLAAARLPLGARLAVATVVEAAWEILENSPIVIDRYRTATMAADYYGDSVLNSVSDILCMAAGFFLARRLPVWASVALALFLEALAAYVIRDNLTLNVLMLLWPVEAVKTWQAGG